MVWHNKRTSIEIWVFMLFIFLFLFFLWSFFFKIDQTVRSSGVIISSDRNQIIQVADGGVLVKLLVKEGSYVKKGQLLATLEKERAKALYEESLSRLHSLKIQLKRYRSEISGTHLEYGDDFEGYDDLIKSQYKLYEQKKKSLDDEINHLKELLFIAEKELVMNQNLLSSGDISHLEVMRTRRQVIDLKGKIKNVKNKYFDDSYNSAAEIESKIEIERHKLYEREDILNHTNVLSPVEGIVNFISVTTIGGVLRPGDELMQLSPTNDDIFIEAKIRPMDIGNIKKGQRVNIKLSAFDFVIYGSLLGKLNYISSDTLTESIDGKLESYYTVHVLIDKEHKNSLSKFSDIKLKPGMGASIDVITGERTVLSYITKPIVRAFSGALGEK
ncbi:HlyD family efflux transporter periplasmic adaptor subunit (plasmid) [Vibrio sp. nBUS_14]|mgnify:CR=1 FL=1|uniref:HlyD family efflux transporter periplasmic adaptor subunit n=1 Tax=Vibrio sp. nBUS_14 TaxID=3395321 RepID=UPI003EB6EF21